MTDEFPEIVSATFTGTAAGGSCTIRYDATSSASMRVAVKRLPAAWMIASKMRRVRCAYDERQRNKGWNCGPCRRILQAELWLVSRAVVSVPSCGTSAKPYVSAGACNRQLRSSMRNHSQCAKLENSTPIVVEALEPAVYIHPIVPCRINSVLPKMRTDSCFSRYRV